MNGKSNQTWKFVFRYCLATLGLLTLITLASSIWLFNLLSECAIEGKQNCATYNAQPISVEVVSDLCKRNLLPTSISECNSDMAPIQIQYVIDIVKSNVIQNRSTHDDVTKMFGKYEVLCEEPSRGSSIFRCTYDISGVGQNIYVFFNDETKLVESIRGSSCGKSS